MDSKMQILKRMIQICIYLSGESFVTVERYTITWKGKADQGSANFFLKGPHIACFVFQATCSVFELVLISRKHI